MVALTNDEAGAFSHVVGLEIHDPAFACSARRPESC